MQKIYPPRLLLLAFLLMLSIRTVAQIAITDHCATPNALPVNTTCFSNNYAIPATFDNDGPAACDTSYRDGWYQFTTGAATNFVEITGTSNRQMGLALYTACAGASVSCTVPGAANATLNSAVSPNTTYWLRIMRTNNANTNNMTGTICVRQTTAVLPNDDCSGAISLTASASCNYTTYTTVSATSSTAPAPGCASYNGNDVWFAITVPASGTFTVDTQTGGITDSGMALYSGSCGSLTLLACDDDSSNNGLMSQISQSGLTPGSIVYARVWSYNNASSGTFGICVTEDPACPANSLYSGYHIQNFNTTGGISNISNNASGFSAGGYGDFTAQSVSQQAGGSINFSANFNGSSYTFGFAVWADWNADGDFSDAGEALYSSGAYVTNAAGSITIPPGTPVGNYRLRIRADYYSISPSACTTIEYGETEDYTISVTTPPPCSGYPSGLTANPTGSGTATISWTAASPAPASGYQYYFGTSAAAPNMGSTPSGSTAAGVLSANLSGLTNGLTYYVWVRSNCGGALGQGLWIGPVSFVIPTCGIGNGTGTTTMGCPSVLSGGLGLNGSDPTPIDCTTAGCVDLEATYLQLGQTSDYTVESIPYNPPYQFHCLRNAVSVNDDDVWSPVINLPFNFCFYGNTYNSCLISSNGVVTFDLVNNDPGGSSTWEFDANLPNNTLFLNSIFGVYHDIDPSIGGQVGWELITLNTGCRALVASWHDIPMYSSSCNSQLYTGMIVLYENTNIIDVYIEQKSVCGTWNDGNAIVGIQNAAATQAVVAPNRNGLSPDWTVTNEAWRFIPSGTAITSISWFEGSGTSGPVIGNTDTIQVCPAATTTYTAQVTYTLCNGITLIETDETTVTVNQGKTWNGSVNSNWNVSANWTPAGVPTAAHCVRVPNTVNPCIVSGSAFNAYAYSVRVENGGVLRLNSENNLTVTNQVDVIGGGTFDIMNSASLLQINDVANSGTATLERITRPMYRYDYTYWNSPMTASSGFTLGALSPLTLADKFYSWTPFVGSGTGQWQPEAPSSLMNPTKGYIIRAPQTYSTNPSTKTPYTGTFTGTPNNGPVDAPVAHGSLAAAITHDKWNLIGNPYPSGVNAAAFLMHPQNVAAIDGIIYFWTHNSAPSEAYPDPFYGDFVLNYTDGDYASWNLLGSVSTIASTGGPSPTGVIAAGQAVFVKSLLPAGNARFTNSMRIGSVAEDFFRLSDPSLSNGSQEPNLSNSYRIWLNMNGESNTAFCQTLVGYAEGATTGYERALDGRKNEGASLSFYSLIPEERLVIQARPLPFDVQDQVPLGVNCPASGTYHIGIDRFDPFFEMYDIYLEDKWADVIHDLKQAPYSFSLDQGRFDDRFVLRYAYPTMAINEEPEEHTNVLFLNQGQLHFQSGSQLQDIRLYDLTGKLLNTFTPIDADASQAWVFNYQQATYMAVVTLKNGESFGRKILNR